MNHCSDPLAGLLSLAGNCAWVDASCGRVLVRLLAINLRMATLAPGILCVEMHFGRFTCSTQSYNVSDLPLWQITPSGRYERIFTGSPVGTSPVAHGMPLGRERVEFEFEKETVFLVSFGFVWAFPSYKTPGIAICRFGR